MRRANADRHRAPRGHRGSLNASSNASSRGVLLRVSFPPTNRTGRASPARDSTTPWRPPRPRTRPCRARACRSAPRETPRPRAVTRRAPRRRWRARGGPGRSPSRRERGHARASRGPRAARARGRRPGASANPVHPHPARRAPAPTPTPTPTPTPSRHTRRRRGDDDGAVRRDWGNRGQRNGFFIDAGCFHLIKKKRYDTALR